MTRLPKKDIIATCAVAVAVVLYLLWLFDATLPGMSGVRVTGMAVLALGFAASATAVVPSFDKLMHGSRLYLAVTSLLGLAALAAGIVMLVSVSGAALGVLTALLFTLWVVSTTHHVMLARTAPEAPTGEPSPGVPAKRHVEVR
jgi:predicted branched-subunit amino acid permease